MSVKDLVLKEENRQKREAEDYIRKQKEADRRKLRKQQADDIKAFICEFERKYFNVNSTEKEVAEKIVYIRQGTWRRLVTTEQYKHITFDPTCKIVNCKYTLKDKKFLEWKTALQSKFDIHLDFREKIRYEKRFNPGFETYPNEIYEGIEVIVTI